jgi:hypothetical protein
MALTTTFVGTNTTEIFQSGNDTAITTVMFCNNNTTVSTSIDVYAVASGGVVGTGTMILRSLSLPPAETFVMDAEKLILSNGDAIWAKATVNSIVVATVSSVSI